MDNTLDLIIKHGLTIRQIPHTVKSTFDAMHYERHSKKDNETLSEVYNITYPSGIVRKFFDVITVPKDAGY